MSKHPVLMPALGAAVLLVTGLAVLVPGTPTRPIQAPAAAAPAAGPPPAPSDQNAVAQAVPTPAPAGTSSPTPAPTATPTTAPSSPATAGPVPSGAAAVGDGPQGDPAIQAAFTADHPGDLAPADTAQLTALASAVWLAETTGQGHARWPGYFPTARGAAPAHFYSGVRIQAAAAHTEDGRPDRVRVDLLWTGTSPIGEYGDRRPATVHLARINGTWEPVR